MAQTMATVREAAAAGTPELVLPRSELDRLGLVSGALVAVEVQIPPRGAGVGAADATDNDAALPSEGILLRDLQQALAAADAGDVLDDDSVRQEFVARFAGRVSPEILRQLQES